MTIKASVVADSISPEGKRITTVQLYYPRPIHAEFMTHCAISKSASGSRAVPVAKVLEQLKKDPFIPAHWGANQRGMVAGNPLSKMRIAWCKFWWLRARDFAMLSSRLMQAAGLHKQIANRITEPWTHIHVVATATEWANFFSLRCAADAEPHMRDLAMAVLSALNESTPTRREYGEWHLPYVTDEERKSLTIFELLAISSARCARVSYMRHGTDKLDTLADIRLFKELQEKRHVSPMAHQGRVIGAAEHSGNFIGWEQHRKLIPGENCTEFDGLK